jgi:flagellar biosynthesis/type III secretory pathway M-ring protein FliF/YscJ
MNGIMGYGKIAVLVIVAIIIMIAIFVISDVEKKKYRAYDKWILFTDGMEVYYDLSQIVKLKNKDGEYYYDGQKGDVSKDGEIMIFPNATLMKSHYKVFLNRLYKDGKKIQV